MKRRGREGGYSESCELVIDVIEDCAKQVSTIIHRDPETGREIGRETRPWPNAARVAVRRRKPTSRRRKLA
jgi:hypothetical protein